MHRTRADVALQRPRRRFEQPRAKLRAEAWRAPCRRLQPSNNRPVQTLDKTQRRNNLHAKRRSFVRTRQQTSSPPESRRGMGNAGSLSATPPVRRSRWALPTLGQPRSTASTDNPTPGRLRPRIWLSASVRPPRSRAVVPTAHFLRPVRSNTLELAGKKTRCRCGYIAASHGHCTHQLGDLPPRAAPERRVARRPSSHAGLAPP